MSAYGYERGFIVEHDSTLKRKIDCKDCNYYDKSDKSCIKTPRYLPEDGYNSWRYCNYFELDTTTSYYDEKKAQYIEQSKRQAKKEIKATKEKFSKKNQKVLAPKKLVQQTVKTQKTNNKPVNNALTDAECRNLSLQECENFKMIPKPKQTRLLPVYLDSGKCVKVVACVSGNRAYVVAANYSNECMQEVRRIFRKKRQKKSDIAFVRCG